ncbi:excalibur calcium-binding domain-containing protein [Streptosporangium sp. NPDC023615]|uniref:excalibur calcium-binding domain-containing protein n=1 Tax=Streptosporangium sp. NPDC023615 TaxID=3154794 RepID=UPI00342C079F
MPDVHDVFKRPGISEIFTSDTYDAFTPPPRPGARPGRHTRGAPGAGEAWQERDGRGADEPGEEPTRVAGFGAIAPGADAPGAAGVPGPDAHGPGVPGPGVPRTGPGGATGMPGPGAPGNAGVADPLGAPGNVGVPDPLGAPAIAGVADPLGAPGNTGVPGKGAPGSGGPPAGGGPVVPRASRATTAILVAALVVVVLVTGILGTIAVLMTRNPDMPLGAPPPSKLAAPIHFAPVTEVKAGACTVPETYPDDLGQNCYTVAAGISVNAVRKIEAVQEKSGVYSVRIAFAPAFREQINALTEEAVNAESPVRQQIAIVVGEKVVAAPRVVQAITDDSLSIAGALTKEQADAMVVRLRGSGAPVPQSTSAPQTGESVFTPPVGDPAATDPAATDPAATTSAPAGPAATGPAATGPAATTSATNGSATNGSTTNGPAATNPATRNDTSAGGLDPKYADCKQVAANGYGPYFRDSHEEYKWYVDGDGDGVACESGT